MEIKIPEIGESIVSALVANWLVKDGATVSRDDIICELETDKVNVELHADADGILHITVKAGETVAIGTVIATIEAGVGNSEGQETAEKETKEQEPAQQPDGRSERAANPAARNLAREKEIDLAAVTGTGRNGRVTIEDVRKVADKTPTEKPGKDKSTQDLSTGAKPLAAQREKGAEPAATARREAGPEADPSGRPVTRQAMTPIRQRIAARLLQARQQTAMLTTFNEADMSWIKKLRSRHQENFTARHGIKLGMMSFFVKASIEALKAFPAVNARIDGSDIVYHHYYDIGIAVGTERGLVVPVLRDADRLTFAEIEQQIAALAEKANARKLTMADLDGGTFTISNGGIYGSLLSTPIINPPQCGVLGMHAILDRPVVKDSEIVIRPIMNLALSYDHRLIDGREAVGFLKLIKEFIEDPSELFLEL